MRMQRRQRAAIARLSAKDGTRYTEFAEALQEVAEVFAKVASITPPGIDKPSPEDLWNLFKAGRGVRSLGKTGIFDLLRWGPMAVADFVSEFFETELLRAAIAARGIFGCALGRGLRVPLRCFCCVRRPMRIRLARRHFPRGGLGRIHGHACRSRKSAGAEIRTSAEVQQIRTKDGAVTGVVLADGEEIACEAVVSGVDPKRTFFKLLDPRQSRSRLCRTHEELSRQRQCGQGASGTRRFAATFHRSPNAVGPDGFRQALSGRIHIGHEIDYLERAYDASKYGEISYLALSRCHHSHAARSFACAGREARSFGVLPIRALQIERRELGASVDGELGEHRHQDARRLFAESCQVSWKGVHVITPLDLESTYGFTGGHIFHGEIALDQIFTMRPVLDWARYQTPVRGLFLCSNGTHPGNGLTGRIRRQRRQGNHSRTAMTPRLLRCPWDGQSKDRPCRSGFGLPSILALGTLMTTINREKLKRLQQREAQTLHRRSPKIGSSIPTRSRFASRRCAHELDEKVGRRFSGLRYQR